MKLASAVIGGLVLAVAPLAAMAEDMSYSYVEADYVDLDIDDAPSGDGFALRGSVGFAGNWFAFAEYVDAIVGRHRHREHRRGPRRPLRPSTRTWTSWVASDTRRATFPQAR